MIAFAAAVSGLSSLLRAVAKVIAYPVNSLLDRSESKGKTYYRRRRRQQGKPDKSEQISVELYHQLQSELLWRKLVIHLTYSRTRRKVKMLPFPNSLRTCKSPRCA